MQLLYTYSGKKSKNRTLIILVCIAVAIGAGVLGWMYLQPRYQHWKQKRALAQAKEFIAERNTADAQIAIDVAIKAVPNNPEALRSVAEMLEQLGSPHAVRMRRVVAQLEPNSIENVEALVNSCIRFNDLNAARDALTSLSSEQSSKPAGLRAALAFAMATNNEPIADILFQCLETNLPKDDNLKQAHNILYLRHPKAERREQAQKTLERIATEKPETALKIHRQFALHALLRRDYPEARKWFDVVIKHPEATFADHLQVANLELLIDKNSFQSVSKNLAPLAEKNAADAVQYAQWLLVQGRASETAQWLSTLPAQIQAKPQVKSARANAALLLGDLDTLTVLLREQVLGPISKETINLAMAAHAVSAPDHLSLRKDTWSLALNSGSGNLGTLSILRRLAISWSWETETEQTLWTIAKGFPEQTWAHQELFNLYRRRKDTKSMRDVIGALRDSDPTVARYQHDWALFTLLCDTSGSHEKPTEIMKQLYQTASANPNYATGYGFALAISGKGAEALSAIANMLPEDRDYPPRQPYLAYIYGVARKSAELERTVMIASKAGIDLLPEENNLFVSAREKLLQKEIKTKQVPTKLPAK